jgi:hypothetical protein
MVVDTVELDISKRFHNRIKRLFENAGFNSARGRSPFVR